MGFAILWVVLFHSGLVFNVYFVPIKHLGYLGVDIFMLCSGLGVAFSLKKRNLSDFYWRRFKRLAIPYYPVLGVLFLMNLLSPDVGKSKMLQAFMFTDFWRIPDVFNWFVGAIAGFYLVAPILYGLLKEHKFGKGMFAVLAGASVLLSLCFLHDSRLTALSRLPLFLLGLYMGGKDELPEGGSLWSAILLCVVSLVGFYFILEVDQTDPRGFDLLWGYGLWWYPAIVFVPALCYVAGTVIEKIGDVKVIRVLKRFVDLCGEASFEIFLTHLALFDFILPGFGLKSVLKGSNPKWWGMIAISVLAGLAYHFILKKATAAVEKLVKKRKESVTA